MKFKITNDDSEDNTLNKKILKRINEFKGIEEDADAEDVEEDADAEEDDETDADAEEDDETDADDCTEPILKLKVPPNPHLNQSNYDIIFKDSLMEFKNCDTFTDVEWIITYYNPNQSKNVILTYFFNCIKLLNTHLSELVTIDDSKIQCLNKNKEYVDFDINSINKCYVLPGKSLIYYNVSQHDEPDYNIMKNLIFVPQMTFSCNILNVSHVMKQLLSITYDSKQLSVLTKYQENNSYGENPTTKSIIDLIHQTASNENYDIDSINSSIKIVNKLLNEYTADHRNIDYLFDLNNIIVNESLKKFKMYLFLIIYKLYIYLNSYLEYSNEKHILFKKTFSFAVRHSNYILYLEMKKLLREIFLNKFANKDETFINEKIIHIMQNIINDDVILKLIYTSRFVRSQKKSIMNEIRKSKQQNELRNKYFGNPLYSISSYFSHFEKNDVDEENKDWLVLNRIDEKSTKFELNADTIIIEFRDFPTYCYLHLFLTSNDEIRKNMIDFNLNPGSLNLQIVNDYIQLLESR